MGRSEDINTNDFAVLDNASIECIIRSFMGNAREVCLVASNCDEAVMVFSEDIGKYSQGSHINFYEVFNAYLNDFVYDKDRNELYNAVNPATIKKILIDDGATVDVAYRDVSTGVPVWCLMRVCRLSEDKYLYGYFEQDAQTIARHISHESINDCFALYVIDLDTEILTVVKDSPFFERGEGAMVAYEEGIKDFVSVITGDSKKFFEQLEDKDFIVEQLSKSDKKTFTYESDLAGTKHWVSMEFSAVRRDENGVLTAFSICVRLHDKGEATNFDAERSLRYQSQIIDVVGTAFILLNFVNLDKNSFTVIKDYKDEVYHKLIDSSKSYSDSIWNWIETMVHPEDRAVICKASDISYLKSQFENTNLIEATIRLMINGEYRYVEINFAKTDTYEETSEIVVYCVDRHDETLVKLRQKEETEIVVARRTAALKEANKSLNLLSDRVLEFIGDLVESRNEESGQHIRRVKGYTKILAQQVMENLPEYNLDEETVRMIVHASALHDIGKIAIPDKVLLKPGRLDADEFEIMKSHSERGAEIVKKMEDIWETEYIALARDICYYHHEKWDGRGYPKGLKEDEIPISAQIVSIADIYDALTTERCYKKAFSKDVAYNMILNGECGTFSDKLLACFAKAREEFENYSMDSSDEGSSDKIALVNDSEFAIPSHVKYREFIADTLPMLMKITEDMPTACFCYYATGGEELILYNNNLVSIFGCDSREEFAEYVGNSFKGIVYSEDYYEVENSIKYQIENSDNNVNHVVFNIKRKDGAIRKVDDYGHLIHSDDLGDVYFVFLIDITEYGYGFSSSTDEEKMLKMDAFQNHTILLVDDDELSRDIACEILENEGATVIEAFDGKDAVNKYNATKNLDMILMDIEMTNMNGIEATRQIKSLQDKNNVFVPVMCVTADTDEKMEKECNEAGADGFIRKPLNVLELSLKYAALMKKRTLEMQGKIRESMLLANTDSLTKVKNATAYAEKVGTINLEILNGANVKYAIVMCDVNNLKVENDTYGHDSGDVYIKNCCKIISQAFKHSPIYRIGGDEFIAIVEGADYDNRDFIMAGLLKNVEMSSKYATTAMGKASFAMGMAVYNPLLDRSVSDTVKRADEEMYKKKIDMKSNL